MSHFWIVLGQFDPIQSQSMVIWGFSQEISVKVPAFLVLKCLFWEPVDIKEADHERGMGEEVEGCEGSEGGHEQARDEFSCY